MKKFTTVLLLFFTLGLPPVSGQSYADESEVMKAAIRLRRPLLLVFSGSDWCLPCIKLEKTVFSNPLFSSFAKEQFLFLKVDFPQKQKLSAEQAGLNDQLAEKYNPAGEFPLVILLNPAGGPIHKISFEQYSAVQFVEQLKEILKTFDMAKEYSAREKLMGSAFEFIITAEDEETGRNLLGECVNEVRRIESLLTEFDENSETSLINKNAGSHPVTVSEETYGLLERCRNISELSGGAFDISSGLLKRLYKFRNAAEALPPANQLAEVLQKTGFRKIRLLSGMQVSFQTPGMHIGFGAIGKGYAADRVKELMTSKGVKAGVINASGDLSAWGLRSDGSTWKAGIAHPADRSKTIAWLPLEGLAMATSGNYEQFFESDGKRYSHNIDPRTGLPAQGINSVTILSPSAELSDALATAVTVMGVKQGLHFVNQLPRTFCIIADKSNRLHCSDNVGIDQTYQDA